MSDKDRPIVERVLRGDLDAFAELVRHYEGPIVNYVYWIVLDRQDAQDIAQEVFLKVYLSLDKYKPEFKFSTWLFTIARHAAIDALRRASPQTVALESDAESERGGSGEIRWPDLRTPSPEQHMLQDELGRQIGAAVNRLPLPYREVLIMRHLNELPYEDIAKMLDLPLGTVKNRLFRARELLRERLQGTLGAERVAGME